MRTKRSLLPLALTAAVAVAASACSSGSDGNGGKAPTKASAVADYNPQPYDKVEDGGTYTTSYVPDEQWNPFNADSSLTGLRIWSWYNADAITFSPTGTVRYNPDYYSDVKVEAKGGKQTVTLTINPKATFNDGTPIDYRAIEATWKANSGKNKAYNAQSTEGYDKIVSVRPGKDDKQAVIHFDSAVASWPALFTTFLHPKAGSVENYNTAYVKKAHPEWGAGPYTVDKWDRHTGEIDFVRNRRWWGKKGKLDKRIYVNMETQASNNAFRNGQLDYNTGGSAEDLKQLSGVEGTEIRRGGSPFQYHLSVNTKSPLLKDIKVRQAILDAIDRTQIATIQFQNLDYKEPLPGSNLLYSFQKGYRDTLSSVVQYDPKRSQKLLDEAGWKPGSDGIRVKDGKKLSVAYTLLGDEPLAKARAGAFRAMLKKVGVDLRLRKEDEAEFSKIISERRFDLFLSGDRSLDPYGARYLCQFYCSDSDSNLTGTGSKQLDEKIAAVSRIADRDRQNAEASKVEKAAFGQYAFLPLYSGPSLYGVKKGLANVGATLFDAPLPETVGYQK